LTIPKSIRSVAIRFVKDNIPAFTAYEDFLKGVPSRLWEINPETGICGRSPLKHLENEFIGLIKHISSSNHIQKHVEKEYRSKFNKPQNAHVGAVYRRAIHKAVMTPELPCTDDVEILMLSVARIMGFGIDQTLLPVWAITPPKANSNVGFVVHDGEVRNGSKGANWLKYLRIADDLEKTVLEDDFLELNRVYDLEYLRAVVRKYYLYFLLLSRLDGGPDKPRIIWAGSGPLYALESKWLGAHEGETRTRGSLDVTLSPFVATDGKTIRQWLEEFEGEALDSEDVSYWDLSQLPVYTVAVYKVLCIVYRVPPRIAVLIIAYNVCGFVITSDGSEVYSIPVEGKVRSGTGAFPKANMLLRGFYNAYASLKFTGYIDPGLVFGDDSASVATASVKEKSDLLRTRFNITLKPRSQLRSDDGIVLCRRVYLHGRDYSTPVAWSVLRNYIMHERLTECPFTIAYARRTQLENVTEAYIHERKWLGLIQKMLRLYPKQSYMHDLPMSELSLLAEDWAVQKRAYLRLRL